MGQRALDGLALLFDGIEKVGDGFSGHILDAVAQPGVDEFADAVPVLWTELFEAMIEVSPAELVNLAALGFIGVAFELNQVVGAIDIVRQTALYHPAIVGWIE